ALAFGLSEFGDPEAAAAVERVGRVELQPFAAALPAEVTARLEVVDEGRSAEVRIGGANAVDQRPEAAGVGRALAPAGEERAAVGKRQREAQIEADEGTGRHLVSQPVEDLRPGPAVAGPDEARCVAPELADRHGNAAVP